MGCAGSHFDPLDELQSDPQFASLKRTATEHGHVLKVSSDGIVTLEPLISGLAIKMRGPSTLEEIPKVLHEIRIVLNDDRIFDQVVI